ncbi:50S ribosomal protein L7Ae [Candidatus Woesearchaeota archaeon]|nr:50S ribosomal protein L7Ae [Candidatus Woesearchaeota archaeon]
MALEELSKDMVEKVYEAVEVAKATGKIRKGTNEATKALEKGTAKLVVIAKDVSPPEITMHIPLLAEEKNVVCVQVPSKEELGAAAGIDKGAASIAIVQEGEAKEVLKEIIQKAGKKE